MIDATIVRAHQDASGASKKGSQAIGHSRGGPTTKIHARVDALGAPCLLVLTEGQTHDITQTETLVAGIHGAFILADKGYDSKKVIELIESLGCVSVIPARKCCAPREIDWHLRFEKLAVHFLAMVMLAATLVWLA